MNAFLDFINFEYTREELIERVQDYLGYYIEADKLLNEKGPNSAVKYIRPIRQQIDNEYSNYSRPTVQKIVSKNDGMRSYYDWLQAVSTKTIGQVTSKNIESFLDNMKAYAHFYFPDAINWLVTKKLPLNGESFCMGLFNENWSR